MHSLTHARIHCIFHCVIHCLIHCLLLSLIQFSKLYHWKSSWLLFGEQSLQIKIRLRKNWFFISMLMKKIIKMREKVQINLNFLPWHVTAYLPYTVCPGTGFYPSIRIRIRLSNVIRIRICISAHTAINMVCSTLQRRV